MKRIAFLATCALFAVACRDSTSPPVASAIALSASTVKLDAIGASQTIRATVTDQRGDEMPDATVIWSASSPSVNVAPAAGSPDDAVITATANGTATVVARAGSATVAIEVAVAQLAATLEKTSGDAQVGPVNAALGQPVSVRVLDRLGAPIAGQAVAFAVTQGGGALRESAAMTGVDGVASTSWTLGTSVALAQQATATVGWLPVVTFAATAVAGAPAALTLADGDGQTGTVGGALPTNPNVVVKDAFGNAASGVTVTFTAKGGAVASTTAVSNANGIATPGTWTLGTTPGTKTLAASIVGPAGVVSVSFSATARVGSPSSIQVFGNNQSALVNTTVAVRPGVRVSDGFANPIPGLAVTFAVAGGGGSLANGAAMTDANGVATAGTWTLGQTPGTNTLLVVIGNSSMAINATATSGTTITPTGPSGTMMVNTGDNQAAMAGQRTPTTPSVLVEGANGNALAGVTVTFAVTGGGGSVSAATAVSDANGVATVGGWTLGAIADLNTLTATASGYGSVRFTAAGCEGGGAGFAITVCYRTTMTTSQRQAFVDAAARWKSFITSDLPDVPVNVGQSQCDAGSPSMNLTVDDLLIFAAIEPIDGVGSILGSAGWCLRRTSGPPVAGTMRFDAADVAALEAGGRLGQVILHEMGHVLGIGTMWTAKNLLLNPSTTGTINDTYFAGAAAIAAFDAMGGGGYTGGMKVPVENAGGSGTMNAHWREFVLGNELMTGWLNSGANPLTALTVRSLADIGYTVTTTGVDPLTLFFGLNASRTEDWGRISLDGDTYTGRQSTIDGRGRVTRIR